MTSPVLQNLEDGAGSAWLADMQECHAIITGILRIMHPDLYKTACEAITKIAQRYPDLKPQLDQWGCPFTAVSVISNRVTPAHRDSKSRKQYFDILTSVGTFNKVKIKFEGLGYEVEMEPGGVCGLLGHVVNHEVPDWGPGDRVCVAWYMRSSVHASMDVFPADWMAQDRYRDVVNNPTKYLGRPFRSLDF